MVGQQALVCRIAVLMTCFNRRDLTLACLRALHANQQLERMRLRVVLIDDGSSDGTAKAVSEQFPDVLVEYGSGALYWCRGMCRASELARQQGPDYFLWLNDDTHLQPDALLRLLECERELRALRKCPVIVVGLTADAVTGAPTYGGVRRSGAWNPVAFVRLGPSQQAQKCATMNGNCVLVPADVDGIVGPLDPGFEHAMGDVDFGLRANALGVEVWQAPGVVGTCSANDAAGTFRDARLSLPQRWRLLNGRKCLPWRSWLRLTRRHGGLAWPLVFGWPYARLIAEAGFQDLRRLLTRQMRRT